MDCLLWLEKEKSDCNGKKPKIPIILVFVFLKQDSHMLFVFLKLVKPVYAVTSIEWSPVFKSHIFVICHRIFHTN